MSNKRLFLAKSGPAKHLDKALNDEDWRVREAAAKHDYRGELIAAQAAIHPNASLETKKKIYEALKASNSEYANGIVKEHIDSLK